MIDDIRRVVEVWPLPLTPVEAPIYADCYSRTMRIEPLPCGGVKVVFNGSAQIQHSVLCETSENDDKPLDDKEKPE